MNQRCCTRLPSPRFVFFFNSDDLTVTIYLIHTTRACKETSQRQILTLERQGLDQIPGTSWLGIMEQEFAELKKQVQLLQKELSRVAGKCTSTLVLASSQLTQSTQTKQRSARRTSNMAITWTNAYTMR